MKRNRRNGNYMSENTAHVKRSAPTAPRSAPAPTSLDRAQKMTPFATTDTMAGVRVTPFQERGSAIPLAAPDPGSPLPARRIAVKHLRQRSRFPTRRSITLGKAFLQ